MAVIWQKQQGATLYQVRTAGASVRLYTNKVFHSQWNPNAILNGGVWDLLLMPVFMLANPSSIKKVLVLGVGGGAIVRSLAQSLNTTDITGVDLDPTHLTVARRFFGVHPKAMGGVNCELHCAEASAWLKRNKTKFDLIVEDVFKESDNGEPIRAIPATEQWLSLLRSRLSSKGTLVMNFDGSESWQEAKALAKQHRLFPHIDHPLVNCSSLALPQYENRIGVFSLAGLNKHSIMCNAKTLAAVSPAKLEKIPYKIVQHRI